MGMDESLLKQLQRIADAMESYVSAIKVSKAPELWTTVDIATWLKLANSEVRDRIVKLPTFPSPFSPTQSKQGHKVWFAADVIEWARINTGKLKHKV